MKSEAEDFPNFLISGDGGPGRGQGVAVFQYRPSSATRKPPSDKVRGGRQRLALRMHLALCTVSEANIVGGRRSKVRGHLRPMCSLGIFAVQMSRDKSRAARGGGPEVPFSGGRIASRTTAGVTS